MKKSDPVLVDQEQKEFEEERLQALAEDGPQQRRLLLLADMRRQQELHQGGIADEQFVEVGELVGGLIDQPAVAGEMEQRRRVFFGHLRCQHGLGLLHRVDEFGDQPSVLRLRQPGRDDLFGGADGQVDDRFF